MKLVDLTNQKFGRLIVLSRADRVGDDRPHWACSCDCGNGVIVSGTNLRGGNTQSCGCLFMETHSGENSNLYKHGLFISEYNRQVKGALKRDLVFDLTKEQVEDLFSKNCYYSGTEPKADNRGLVRNGIDRLDSSIGYNEDNCVSCCDKCNMMKRAMGAAEFTEHVLKIAAFLNKKGN